MPFTLKVACDVGSGKLNTAIEFDSAPISLRDVIAVVEALYTVELRVHRGDDRAKFRCVSLMKLGENGQWSEVVAADQLSHNTQLFAFDWGSANPTPGPLPTVQFVVTAQQVLRVASRPLDTSKASVDSTARDNTQQQQYRTPPSQASNPPLNATPAQASDSRGAAPASRPAAFAPLPADGPHHADSAARLDAGAGTATPSRLPPDAKQYLFEQLCRAGGSANEISTHRLHGIFVEYGLTFSTEAFSEIVGARYSLDRVAWSAIEQGYGPVIDALYDRIATRSEMETQRLAMEAAKQPLRAPRDIRSEIEALEEEDARLMARRAEIRLRTAELQRELRESEAQAAADVPNSSDDRAKEWDTLQKFVALRHRQALLRKEEDRVRHELSLL